MVRLPDQSRKSSFDADIANIVGGGTVTAAVTFFDETVMRVEGSPNWFHIAITNLFYYLWLGNNRGDAMT